MKRSCSLSLDATNGPDQHESSMGSMRIVRAYLSSTFLVKDHAIHVKDLACNRISKVQGPWTTHETDDGQIETVRDGKRVPFSCGCGCGSAFAVP